MKYVISLFTVVALALAVVFIFNHRNDGVLAVPLPPVPVVLADQSIPVSSSESIHLKAPANLEIKLAASGLGRTRFMAWAPDGRLFVTDMHDLSDNSLGTIYVLDGFSEETGTFVKVTHYLDNLRNPNSVAFQTDSNGDSWIYIVLTDRLLKYPYHAGDTHPTEEPTVLAHFPDYGLSYKYGGWHLTRTLAFYNDQLYISIGSSCDSCEEKEALRASIWFFSLDGDMHPYATGLRNAVGLKSAGGNLYATGMGVDKLGNNLPNELFYKLSRDTNYGWPYCYQSPSGVLPNTTQVWTKQFDCSKVPNADAIFDAHSAPLGLEYFDAKTAVPELQGSFLVALHGASTPSIGSGYKIVRVHNGTVDDYITGFLGNDFSRSGRPVDILQKDGHSFFFTDDFKGRLYYARLRE